MISNHDSLRVLEAHVYRGPSAWGYRPMTRMVLDLGVLENHPSSDLSGFPAALLERLPGLHEHGCSYGRPGGFASRLHEGTWLGHVIEHVAIELQNRLGADVAYGKTRGVRGRPGVYDVAYSHVEERVGPLAGRLAIRLVHDLLPPRMQGVEGLDLLVPEGVDPPAPAHAPFDFDAEFEAFAEAADRLRLGPSSRALADAARERGIPVRRLDGHSLLQLGHGRHARRIRAGVTGATSALAVETASDKALTNELLEAAGLPVPRLAIVDTAEDAVAAAGRIGRPVVLKPAEGNHGRGVSLDLPDDDAVRVAFEEAGRHGRVVVEEHVPGEDHRLLVVDGRLVAAARRVPAHVVGDGRRSVHELVDEANRDPRRGRDHDRPLTRIVLDEHADRVLARMGHDRDSVPAAGEHVELRATANLSTGGTATDVTDDVHPDVAAVAERAATAIGLDVAGIDIVAPRLDRPLAEVGGAIVEVNAGPGLRMHHAPSHGRPRDAAGAIVDMLFPDGSDGRIPLVAITGTNGKTTTARMVARMFEAAGDRVGLATSSGITIGGRKVAGGDTTGPWSAHVVLGDPTVDVAVLETARGGMLRSGLAFDRASVGAVLNVQSDHLGERGIDTLDDMAWIKSLVAEIADPRGHAVLNADDERTAAMAERAGGEVVLFSMSDVGDGPGVLRDHVRAGGVAVVRQTSRRGDLLTIVDDGRVRPVLWSHEIPATLDGLASVNVQNALAAIAVGYVSGLGLGTLAAGLRSFTASYEDNPGRLNLYDGHPFRVVLDYGHNPAGLEALADLVPHLARGGRAIGVVTMAGDRRDEDTVAAGRVAARLFDHVVVREDADLRGREPGEVAKLIVRGLREAGFPASATEVVRPEMEALRVAMRAAGPGDLVMHFAERYEEAWETITGFEPDDVRVPAAASAHDLPQRP